MKREEIRWIPKKPECVSGHTSFITVDLNVIEPAIILLLVGYALAVAIILLELLYHKCANRSQARSWILCHRRLSGRI